MFHTPDNNQQIPPKECYDEDGINLIDFLLVLLKRKGLIFKVVCSVFVLSVIVSLFLPKSYVATARILPPQENESSTSELLSQVSGSLGGLASSILGGGGSSSYIYIGILGSRTVADNLINKYDLKKLYDKKYMADVYKELSAMSSFDVDSNSQIISISVEDCDPQRAADMANSYVKELDTVNKTLNITEGQRKRIFLEKRLKKVREDLNKAETDLKTFQEKYKLVSLDDQAKAIIEGAAEIKAQIIESQTELKVLKDFGTTKQNEAVRLQAKIAELQSQLDRIESGSNDKDNNGFYIPFSKLPDLGMQLADLMREAKIQENVFELLTSQYEMTKIEEAKDVNTIQMLDKAVPPDKKAKPRKSLIVILSTFVAFFLSIFLAFFLEFVEKIKTEDEENYNIIVKNIKDINFKKFPNTLKKYKGYFKRWIETRIRK